MYVLGLIVYFLGRLGFFEGIFRYRVGHFAAWVLRFIYATVAFCCTLTTLLMTYEWQRGGLSSTDQKAADIDHAFSRYVCLVLSS